MFCASKRLNDVEVRERFRLAICRWASRVPWRTANITCVIPHETSCLLKEQYERMQDSTQNATCPRVKTTEGRFLAHTPRWPPFHPMYHLVTIQCIQLRRVPSTCQQHTYLAAPNALSWPENMHSSTHQPISKTVRPAIPCAGSALTLSLHPAPNVVLTNDMVETLNPS